MNIYKNKKTKRLYTDHSLDPNINFPGGVFIDIENGNILRAFTSDYEFIGIFQNGKFYKSTKILTQIEM